MRSHNPGTTLLCIALALSTASWLPPAGGTSVVAPSTEFHAIRRSDLVAAVKAEYSKVGLPLRHESLEVGEHSQAIRLTFDYAPAGDVLLESAVEVLIGSQGEQASECLGWPCDIWFAGPRTHDAALADAIWKAYAEAMTAVESRVSKRGGTTKRNGW